MEFKIGDHIANYGEVLEVKGRYAEILTEDGEEITVPVADLRGQRTSTKSTKEEE